MKKYDLHLHTHYSDGVHSPDEVMAMAKEKGISTVSISDHNWPHHIEHMQELSKKYGLDFVQGIEINSTFDKTTVHILGYSKNFDLKNLQEGMREQIEGFDKRAQKTVENINKSGEILLDYEKLKKDFKGTIGNFPIMIMLSRELGNFNPKVDEIYHKYKEPYGPWLMTPEKAINLIHKSNGIAILAHPAAYWRKFSKEKFNKLLGAVIKAGIDGLEANHSEHSDEEEQEIRKLARNNNLIITGGSDFHGLEIHPHRHLAKHGLDEDDFKIIEEKLDSLNK